MDHALGPRARAPATDLTMPVPPEPPLADAAGISPRRRPLPADRRAAGWRLQATGLLLFLFIPLVLYLFVRHPEPLAASLALGIVLMAGHRLLARPYMIRVIPWKCLWCNRILPPAPDGATRQLDLVAGGQPIPARCCASHRASAARFFRCLVLARVPLRLGIFVPLILLLAALFAAAAGRPHAVAAATALFQLLVGLTVSAAAWGYLLVRSPPAPAGPAALPVPFPAHNFFLLGVRLLLWIFRLVGAWWIYRGAAFFLG